MEAKKSDVDVSQKQETLLASPKQTPGNVTPIGLASWKGGFALAQITKVERVFDGLRLFRFKKPVRHEGELCSYAIERIEMREDRTRVRIKERRFLNVKSRAEAQKAFKMVVKEFTARRDALQKSLPAQEPSPEERTKQTAIANAKFAYLARGYPKTVRSIKAKRSAEETYWAFVEEVAKVSGGLLITSIPTAELVRRIAAHWSAQKKRKNQSYFDSVECALILGCEFKGYGTLPWNSVLQDVRRFTGIRALSVNSLRQKWKRLGLPSSRKRGRKSVKASSGVVHF